MKGFDFMKFDYNKLREARIKRKLTLEDMAKYMKLDISAYWRLETGKTQVKAEQLITFMDFFEKPYSYFFETSNVSNRSINLSVECLPDKLQVMHHFLKEHPGIVNNWEQQMMRIEQELQ